MDEEEEQRKPKEPEQTRVRVGDRGLLIEEMNELASKYFSSTTPKFPESNGSEIACLTEDCTIEILHSSNTDDTHSHGTKSISPDHKDYQYYWKRHCFDNQQGRNHAIMKKWTGENWIDLGDYRH